VRLLSYPNAFIGYLKDRHPRFPLKECGNDSFWTINGTRVKNTEDFPRTKGTENLTLTGIIKLRESCNYLRRKILTVSGKKTCLLNKHIPE